MRSSQLWMVSPYYAVPLIPWPPWANCISSYLFRHIFRNWVCTLMRVWIIADDILTTSWIASHYLVKRFLSLRCRRIASFLPASPWEKLEPGKGLEPSTCWLRNISLSMTCLVKSFHILANINLFLSLNELDNILFCISFQILTA